MNLKEEVRNGYLVTTEMKKVWKVQLDICNKIFDVCNKYGLRIVCCGGTAIGTLREHGYIPWDDDIDLEMLREDYDKLCAIAKDEFKEPYFFQNAYTDKGYCYGHSQVRMSGTTAILKGDVCKKIHLGIFVDIFVLDEVPSDSFQMAKLRKKTETLQAAMSFKSFNHFGLTDLKYYLKSCVKFAIYLPLPLRFLFRKYEDLFRSVKSDKNEVCSLAFSWSSINKCIRPKNMMSHIEWLPFEDILMPVSYCCKEILTRQYGDFMTPAKVPNIHGGFLILDAEHDYRYYLPMLRKNIYATKLQNFLVKMELK